MFNVRHIIILSVSGRKGQAILISLTTIIVVGALAFAVFSLGSSELFMVERQRKMTKALYIAEAGIERAIFDLRQDLMGSYADNWRDGEINQIEAGPDMENFFSLYTSIDFDEGQYTVELKNATGNKDDVWIRSTGIVDNVSQTIEAYVKGMKLSVWDNAIYAGTGSQDGTLINGNVEVRGSVHLEGSALDKTDVAIDLGGDAGFVWNNYKGVSPFLLSKVPVLEQVDHNGEQVESLGAEIRVKHGTVNLSGSATVGQENQDGNAFKETADGSYVTDGYGGVAGSDSVFSDNGFENGYDLENAITFPRLSGEFQGFDTYMDFLRSKGYILTAAEANSMENILPTSTFSYGDARGMITMDGAGNMHMEGIIVIDGDNNLTMNKQGSNNIINYTGRASILVTGNVEINVNLVTKGNQSFPRNIMAIMTPNNVRIDASQIDIMGLFYAEDTITIEKQTDLFGTIVSNYFNMGRNVPAIYQVPQTISNLPPGLIGAEPVVIVKTVSWREVYQ